MTPSEPPTETARVATLEREVRRLTALTVFLSAAVALLVVLHYLPGAPLLEAHELALRDAYGTPRIQMGFEPDGAPMMRLNNAGGRARVFLYLRDDGEAELRFSDRANVHRARIGLAADGRPEVRLATVEGRTSVVLQDTSSAR